ncbi:Pogo transposable element with KRAB domain [Frankliniella fusca]|uniref:Pogo transposable element with KRAB domain n=1 Tax=Frankliniella fusca TaxID=407009 RepID=A0AAE1LWZ5_9NEOP|nr:Pogo transposable element with KRAB domain [Frankliniella fusca]
MPRSKPRKTTKGAFSPQSMKNALLDVRSGMKVRSAAKKHQVDHTTLSRYMKKAKDVEDLDSLSLSPNYATRQVFSKEIEDSLAGYVLECGHMGYGLTANDIRKFALQLAEANNIPNIPKAWKEKKEAGEDWFKGFMARHPHLTARKPEQCSIARAMAFNKENISRYFDKLEEVLKRHPSFSNGSRVYNLDETGTTTVGETKKMKVICEKGVKQVNQIKSAERGTLVSTCCIIGANGTMLPPVMVFPRVKFTNNMVINAYPGTLGLATKNGWMIAEIFVKVIEHFIQHTQSSKENPTLLILDNVSSHLTIEVVDLCRKHGVVLFTLPPHTTHKTQPLDVAVYGPFQAAYSRAYHNWTIAHPAEVCSIYHIAGLVNEALCKAGTPANIFSAFRATGIHPFNNDIFKDVEFVPSNVTDNPNPPPLNNEEVDGTDGHVGLNSEVEQQEDDPGLPDNSQTTPVITTPRKVRPLPKAQPKATTRKPREKGRCRVATDTPEKNQIEEKAEAKKKKEEEKEQRRKAREAKNLEKIINDHSKTRKRKGAFSKNNETAKKGRKIAQPTSDSESDDMEILEESEDERWEGDEDYISDAIDDDNTVKPFTKLPEEGDHILVIFRGKEDRHFVGKVLKEKDEEGDLEVTYYRHCDKGVNKFSLPNVPDLKSVHINDVIALLPKPSVGATRRQQDIICFNNYDFSMFRLG